MFTIPRNCEEPVKMADLESKMNQQQLNDSRALVELMLHFPNKSGDYLSRKLRKYNGDYHLAAEAVNRSESGFGGLLSCCFGGSTDNNLQTRIYEDKLDVSIGEDFAKSITDQIEKTPFALPEDSFPSTIQLPASLVEELYLYYARSFFKEEAAQSLQQKLASKIKHLFDVKNPLVKNGQHKAPEGTLAPDDYRKKAREHYENLQKYKAMVKEEGKKLEEANNCAIMLYLNINRNHREDAFDMHGLHVREVAPCLDVFLDTKICELREDDSTNTKRLYIIPGWGRHSGKNGAQIKPEAIKRLLERGLKLPIEQNKGGELITTIYKNSKMTHELKGRKNNCN